MRYLDLSDFLNYIFKDIRAFDYDDELKPQYENEKDGLNKLNSLLDKVRFGSYCRGFYQKAAYLFLEISSHHSFSNGNKRLALASLVIFCYNNGYSFKEKNTANVEKWLKKYFPDYKSNENTQPFSSSYEWGLFNLSLVVNVKKSEKPWGHEYNFDELKNIVEKFLKYILKRG